ncbi:MAG: hypothetical protein LUC45_07220 [Paraprevotella sp.]|nr:hypothetical protein [Paraprevotella sp.]
MKQLAGFSVALTFVLFTSCSNKENSYDFAQILYPQGSGSVLYADQTVDTLRFATTYDWSVSTTADWLHFNPDSMAVTVPDGYYMEQRLMVGVDVNNTDTLRSAYVYFHADGKVLTTSYTQFNYLNIKRPIRHNSGFVLRDSASQERDSLVFRTYGNDWTLGLKDSSPAWVRLADDAVTSGRAGTYVVYYQLEPNTTTAERTAALELKSRGVSTEIEIKQSGLKTGGK